jgi:hypothetical protein
LAVSPQVETDEIEFVDSTAMAGRIEPAVVPGRRRSGLGLVLVVGAVVVLAVVLGRSGQGQQSSPQPPITEPRPTPPLEVTIGMERGDGPVLGRRTGLSLMVGGAATPLRVLDLDTGDLLVSEVMLSPQFVVGSTLIYTTDPQSWWRTPLAQVPAMPDVDSLGARFLPIGGPARVLPATAGSVWLTWPRSGGGRDWQLIDLATSDVVREVTTSADARILGGSDPYVGPEVISSSDGGVFELQADGSYEQRLEGTLIAVGAEEVLVRDCSTTVECSTAWYRRGDWRPTGRSTPSADLGSGRLVAGERLLVGIVPRPPLGAELYDMSTGEIVRAVGPEPLRGVRVSPDGAWLVRKMFGRVEVVEIETGASTVVPNLPLGRDDSIIWLDTTGRGG